MKRRKRENIMIKKYLLFLLTLFFTHSHCGDFEKVPALVDLCLRRCATIFVKDLKGLHERAIDWEGEETQEYIKEISTFFPGTSARSILPKLLDNCLEKSKRIKCLKEIKNLLAISGDHSLALSIDDYYKNLKLCKKSEKTSLDLLKSETAIFHLIVSPFNTFYVYKTHSGQHAHARHLFLEDYYMNLQEESNYMTVAFIDNIRCLIVSSNKLNQYNLETQSKEKTYEINEVVRILEMLSNKNYIICLNHHKNVLDYKNISILCPSTLQILHNTLVNNKSHLLTFSGHKKNIIAYAKNKNAYLLELLQNTILTKNKLIHQAPVTSLTFSPDEKYMATATNDNEGSVYLWDLPTGQIIMKTKSSFLNLFKLSWAKDNSELIYTSNSEKVYKINLKYFMLAKKLEELLAKNSKN